MYPNMTKPAVQQTAAELAARLRSLDAEDRAACLLALIRDLEEMDPDHRAQAFLDALTAALEVRLIEGCW